jgi:hypothetical protein
MTTTVAHMGNFKGGLPISTTRLEFVMLAFVTLSMTTNI